MKKFLLIVMVFIFLNSSNAQSIVTDRPGQTEASSSVPKGHFQIESGILITHLDEIQGDRRMSLPSSLFRYGLSNTIELRLIHEYAKYDVISEKAENFTISGINDLQVGAKVFIVDSENTQVALISHLIVPSGNQFFTNDDFGTINKLSITHGLSNKFSLTYNLGYDYIQESLFGYYISFGYAISDRMGSFVETYGSFGDDASSNFDSGFNYLIRDNLQIDFSFGFGLNNDMNFTSLGLSWYLPQSKNEKAK